MDDPELIMTSPEAESADTASLDAKIAYAQTIESTFRFIGFEAMTALERDGSALIPASLVNVQKGRLSLALAGVSCEYLAEFLKREGKRRRRRGREERRREKGGREEEKREDSSIITSKHMTSMDIDTMWNSV